MIRSGTFDIYIGVWWHLKFRFCGPVSEDWQYYLFLVLLYLLPHIVGILPRCKDEDLGFAVDMKMHWNIEYYVNIFGLVCQNQSSVKKVPELILFVVYVFAIGQPRRHLLTTGWSVFVSAKRLQAGDAVLFIRYTCEGNCFSVIRLSSRMQIWI